MSDEADAVFDKNLFDYAYVDETTQETTAYVFAEAEVSHVENQTIKNMYLYITVVCHKQFMKLDPTVFKGYVGNRRDNLVRYIDAKLNNSDIFGIGCLSLKSVGTMPAPAGYTARELVYEVPDFNVRRDISG
jgi:hypothetical protein